MLQNLGRKSRVVKCEGCFLGKTADEALLQAADFRSKSGGGSAGMLFIPAMEPMYAALKELAIHAGGDGRIIPYTIVFMEQDPLLKGDRA